jgi:hypothetical protein
MALEFGKGNHGIKVLHRSVDALILTWSHLPLVAKKASRTLTGIES